ncbi:MAG: winged helix-turn-helix domain-containing protein [Acidobacteria bacterium]|nr:winged helix-turn-helix domain-containing protein [Acidobacteriota bacterium]
MRYDETGRVYVFDRFRLEVAERRLLENGAPVALPPRVFDTLVALVAQSGRLVSKEDLLRIVWAGVFVEEANLTVNVSALRKILGETPSGSSYIETVPRKGYRFVGNVAEAAETAAAAPASAAAVPGPSVAVLEARPRRGRALAAIALGLAMIALGIAKWRDRATPAADQAALPRSLAVLPFEVTGGEPGNAAFGLGLADALITRLSGSPELAVRPTSSIASYTAAHDPAAIGRALGVDAVLTGLVQRSAGELRVSVQLVDTRDGRTLFAEAIREKEADVFTLQDTLAGRLAPILPRGLAGASRVGTRSREAYELYLEGRFHWFRWTPEGWARARELYEKAIAADPGYALAYAGLGEAVGIQLFNGIPEPTATRARELAAKALALDPGLAAAHFALGPIQLFHDRDWSAAEATLRKGLALDPGSPIGHDLLGILCSSTGRFDEAVAEARTALALVPLSPYLGWDLAEALLWARRLPEARVQLERTTATEPAFLPVRFQLANVLALLGEDARALEEELAALRQSGTSAETESALRAALKTGGTGAFWRARLVALRKEAAKTYVSPYALALLAARIGDTEEALDALEAAEKARTPELVRVAIDPGLDPVRGEARYQSLVGRLGLATVATVKGPSTAPRPPSASPAPSPRA